MLYIVKESFQENFPRTKWKLTAVHNSVVNSNSLIIFFFFEYFMKNPDDTDYRVVSLPTATREDVKYNLDILKLSCQYSLFL